MDASKNLIEAVRFFKDADVCVEFMAAIRWPDGVKCPTCGNPNVGYLANQRRWQCGKKHPKRQFSVKAGTVFEDSLIGLDKWLLAVWLLVNCKNGISSYEVARDLDVTQKTAWFMLHRIRLAMQTGTFEKIQEQVEADETFMGGLARNMHKAERERKIKGTGGPVKPFRFNERKGTDADRDVEALGNVTGRPLIYGELIGGGARAFEPSSPTAE